MSTILQTPIRNDQAAEAIRVLVHRYDDRTREWLARDVERRAVAMLESRWGSYCFRFREPYRDVVKGIAHEVVAELLEPGAPDGARCLPTLRAEILRCLDWGTPDADATATAASREATASLPPDRELPPDVPGDYLVSALNMALRGRVLRALDRALRIQNSALSRIARNLRIAIRSIPDLQIRRDGRGRFIASSSSDFGRPPLTKDDLSVILGKRRSCSSAMLAVETLRPHLAPTPTYGGYAYLLDVADAILETQVADLERHLGPFAPHQEEYGLPPEDRREPEPMAEPGFDHELGIRAVRDVIAVRVARVRAEDLERHPDWKGSIETEQAYVLSATAIALKQLGIGYPDFDGRSVKDIFLSLDPACSDFDRVHRSRVGYLADRVREWWRK